MVVSRMVASRHAAARWVARIAASAGVIWVIALAVLVLYRVAGVESPVPLPDPSTAAFMAAFYFSVRMLALRFAARAVTAP